MESLLTLSERLRSEFGCKMRMYQKLFRPLVVIAALSLWAASPVLAAKESGPASQGIAIAIVYDTSGSMRETVRAKGGGSAPKFTVANAALKTLAASIEKFATNQPAGSALPVYAGLFTFERNSAKPAIAIGPFERAAFDKFASEFSEPTGNTPLGNALLAAGQALLASPGHRKHLLLITDGANTEGPQPSTTLPRLQQQATASQTGVAVHFVALDVDAKIFNPVKKLGATLVSAADEKQLNSQLDFILQKKILLEDEEK